MDEARQDWTMYETSDESIGRKLWQIRDSFPDGMDEAAYPVAVVIEWPYGDSGLPDTQLLQTLHQFEALLGPLDTRAGNSVLAHIIRGNGVSELCYYARDYDQFMRELNVALEGHPEFPIRIEFMADPGWEYRKSILRSLTSHDPRTRH